MRRIMALTTALCTLSAPAFAAPFFRVASSSMMPTLAEGETMIAVPYTTDKRRGDIVVFTQDGTVHSSRILGLPGETITVIDGIVFIDHTPLPQSQVAAPIADACPALVREAKKCAFYREALPDGTSQVIVSTAKDLLFDNTEPVNLGTDEFFVMSDNRDNAVDSRIYGPVEASAILGKVENIVFSTRSGPSAHRLAGFPDAK